MSQETVNLLELVLLAIITGAVLWAVARIIEDFRYRRVRRQSWEAGYNEGMHDAYGMINEAGKVVFGEDVITPAFMRRTQQPKTPKEGSK